ncbi:MAG: hypothetical protein KGL12_11395 [Rhodospirillales bacterium]|nr:hypothetical protein [Rhodospirillales bacterium]
MDQTRRSIATLAALAGATGIAATTGMAQAALAASPAGENGHRVALQVDSKDPAVMNLALNNVSNIASYYDSRSQKVAIEVVAFGPGLFMLRDDASPVKQRIATLAKAIPDLVFSACSNTRRAMEKAEGRKIPIIAQARMVPAGVVRLIALQEQGWSYIRT